MGLDVAVVDLHSLVREEDANHRCLAAQPKLGTTKITKKKSKLKQLGRDFRDLNASFLFVLLRE